jgi:hypothetical protein
VRFCEPTIARLGAGPGNHGGRISQTRELHQLKGELLLAQDASNAVQAEKSFRTAIESSRRQHAKSSELRRND